MIQSRKRSEPPPRPITFRAAEDLNPFDLAELWADRSAWPVDERTQYDELAELAVMYALAKWLQRWQPIAIHSAMRAGGRPEAVAGAFDNTLDVVFQRWHEWAIQQRDLIIGSKPGITQDEYEAVAKRFVTGGIKPPT
jgi:hypothetical protein